MGLLDGKTAIVTGAGHGIGRAHALELARQGARVVVNDLGSSVHGEGAGKDAEQTVSLIADRGGVAVADYGDVADHEQAAQLIGRAVAEWGQLDILVNNAGIVRDGAVWNLDPADFDAVVRVHLRGTWSCSHHAAVHWRNRAKSGDKVVGRIINTTSGAGLTGNFGQTAYAAAKAGIVGHDLDPGPGTQRLWRHGERRGAGGRNPTDGHHAVGTSGRGARRGPRRRVATDGSGQQLAARGLARQ